MKLKKFFMINVLSLSVLFADDGISNDLPAYQNEITQIFQINGQSRITIRLDSAQSNPIVVYAPKTFQESQDDTIHRLVLPNTTIPLGQSCAFLKQKGKHAQLLLKGKNLVKLKNKQGYVFSLDKH